MKLIITRVEHKDERQPNQTYYRSGEHIQAVDRELTLTATQASQLAASLRAYEAVADCVVNRYSGILVTLMPGGSLSLTDELVFEAITDYVELADDEPLRLLHISVSHDELESQFPGYQTQV